MDELVKNTKAVIKPAPWLADTGLRVLDPPPRH
jgi:hypothetical protein